MGQKKKKKITLKLLKDNGESSNVLENYTGVGTVLFYTNKNLKISEKYYGNIFQGKRHGYGEYNYQNGDFYQGAYEHGMKNGIGTYFYNTDIKKRRTTGKVAKGRDYEKSDDEKSEEDQSEEDKSEEDKSEENQSEKNQSEENQSEEDKSEEEKSEEDQSEEDQSEEDQSEEDQSEEDKSEEDQSEETTENHNRKYGYEHIKKEDGASCKKKIISKKLLNLMEKWSKTKIKKKSIIPPKEEGSFYYGNYFNGLKHSDGMMIYRNGDLYVGGWKFGKKNGWGRYTYKKCKSVLEGHWEDGYIIHGKWILPNGMYFVGNFKNNKPYGDGIWAFKDKTQLNVFYYDVKQKIKKSPKKMIGQGDPNILLNYKPLCITLTR
ncbi:hypothetical protein, conserved [Plasmodium gonderi]|uniref:MORN repeat protein n=1 Tax=Plasmodium gonderi TaxID=77519 RepID=A0A1Y1JH38_PLAGO|nr:hypothetical protein, conserved [Plasmodium gonderi]GAW80527.1 hypothetical protein, conserved [Plasmodium gonderi]